MLLLSKTPHPLLRVDSHVLWCESCPSDHSENYWPGITCSFFLYSVKHHTPVFPMGLFWGLAFACRILGHLCLFVSFSILPPGTSPPLPLSAFPDSPGFRTVLSPFPHCYPFLLHSDRIFWNGAPQGHEMLLFWFDADAPRTHGFSVGAQYVDAECVANVSLSLICWVFSWVCSAAQPNSGVTYFNNYVFVRVLILEVARGSWEQTPNI